jgi:hypothetical protein
MVMSSKEVDLPNQYKILQDSVNQSAIHTNRQLCSINGNTYIGGFILLVLTLGILYFLNIFVYWIPTGFILFYFLLFTILRSITTSFIDKNDKDILKHHKEKHKEITYRIESCLQNNLAIIIQSLAILYIISFFILLSIHYNWIAIQRSIDITVPAITCLLFLPVPIFMKEFTQLLKPSEIKTSLQMIIQKNRQTLWKIPFTWSVIKPFFFGVYLSLLLVMPIISIWILSPVIIQWPYMVLLFLMQSFMIILFTNSFSANSVRKELASTITTYTDINFLLSMATLNNHYQTAEYQHLHTLYQSASPYEFRIKDSFKFINYYMLLPNRFYLKEMLKQTIINTETKSSVQRTEQEGISPFVRPITKEQTPPPNFIRLPNRQPTPQTQTSETEINPPSSEDLSEIMDKKIADIKLGNVGILLYGPMLDNLSSEIKVSLKNHISHISTPFKVELARKNTDLGGAPELVPVSSGGTHVDGDLLIFKDYITEQQAMDMLYRMENNLEGTGKIHKKLSHSTSTNLEIKSLNNFYGIDKVFYPSIRRNINQITPEKLAKLTMDSVINTDEKEPDGFTYLMNLRKHNIKTPMSEAIEEEILNQTASNSLFESRRKLEQVKKIKSSIE